jgi:cytochrome P450
MVDGIRKPRRSAASSEDVSQEVTVTTAPVATAPVLDVDIFSDEVLDNPWSTYRTIRDTAPVVHVEHELYDVYAVGRFEDVRTILKDWHRFTSAEGVSFNDLGNDVARGTVVGCDPPLHDQLQAVMLERLRLSEVKKLHGVVQGKTDGLVAGLVERGDFDAVSDLAEQLVPAVVGELVGISGDALYRFARGGEAIFTVMGPANLRTEESFPVLMDLLQLIGGLTRNDMVPGSMGWALYDAAERGEIPEDMCTTLLLNYVGPGFETTINAIGNALWILGSNPEQWEILRGDPALVPAAVNETLRLESPIQAWSRYCVEGTEIDGVRVPAGSRIAVLLGSANRDERRYADSDHCDVRRNPTDHVAFGHGIHSCVGAFLARAQVGAVLTALLQRARSLECGAPVRRLTNTTRGLRSLPVRLS